MSSHLVARTTDGGANTFTSPAIDTREATLLVAVVSLIATSAPAAVSDSEGNTWTALTGQSVSGQQACQIFYVANPTVSAAHTFTVTGTSIFASGVFLAFSDVATTSPFDQENGATLVGSGTSLATGSITPTEDGELIIVGLSSGGNFATMGNTTLDHLIASPFAQVQIPTSDGAYYGTFAGFGVQEAAAAINPVWTLVNGTGTGFNATAVIASFKAAAEGGAAVPLGWMSSGVQILGGR